MKDYAADGIDIQTAMVRHVKAYPDRVKRPRHILWDGKEVWTAYRFAVPISGRFRLEFLSEARVPPQGFDVRSEGGGISLAEGRTVDTLRTWHEEQYEDAVEYSYEAPDGSLTAWNVFHRTWPDGRTTAEKWTGNAGFRVEGDPVGGLVFRCSHGSASRPDFGQLVVQMSVQGDPIGDTSRK